MTIPAPHYLLFSESRGAGPRPGDEGEWRFALESVDGSNRLLAGDQEKGASADRLSLLAVVRGLEALDQPSRVTLVTSSRYVSRGLQFGLHHWRENRWRWEEFGRLTTIDNADLWQRVDGAMRIHEVRCRAWRFQPGDDPGSLEGWVTRLPDRRQRVQPARRPRRAWQAAALLLSLAWDRFRARLGSLLADRERAACWCPE